MMAVGRPSEPKAPRRYRPGRHSGRLPVEYAVAMPAGIVPRFVDNACKLFPAVLQDGRIVFVHFETGFDDDRLLAEA